MQKTIIKCLVCGATNPDRHHVKSRGAFGDDSQSNIAHLCRRHHTEIHQIGLSTFAKKYKQFENWLLQNGWTVSFGKWRRYE